MLDAVWVDPSGKLRQLPIDVTPLPGETVTGYVGRLSRFHGLEPWILPAHLAEAAGLSPSRLDLERTAKYVEQLAGLPLDHFATRKSVHGVYVRCSHGHWRPTRCPRCSNLQAPRSACLRCSQGVPTTTQSRGGAVCLRHRRWHLGGGDIDISGYLSYRRAEELVSGALWTRGITIQTGELQLACTLIQRWLLGGEQSPVRARARAFGVESLETYHDVLLVAYPEAVALAVTLTDSLIVTELLNPRFSAIAQTRVLEHAVCSIMRGKVNESLHQLAQRIIVESHVAVLSSFGLRRTPNNLHVPCELRKALQVSAKTHRVCLLRHLEARRLPQVVRERTGGAPKTQVVNRWTPVPDAGMLT